MTDWDRAYEDERDRRLEHPVLCEACGRREATVILEEGGWPKVCSLCAAPMPEPPPLDPEERYADERRYG